MATPLCKTSARGANIPAIGFGTGGLSDGCGDLVVRALQAGCRHVDTARNYGTERGVGEAVRASRIARNEIFLTTKVSHGDLRAGDLERSAEMSLRTLDAGWIDLLLVHWPARDIPLQETMGALAQMKQRGLARHIGVANFNIALIDRAIQLCPEPLDALQAEYHPYLDQTRLLDACRRRGMVFIAYCPLGRGRLMDDPVIDEIAHGRGKTAAQIALRWLVQQDSVAAIPRSSSARHIAENLKIFDFDLTRDEVKRIEELKRANGRIANPAELAPLWDV